MAYKVCGGALFFLAAGFRCTIYFFKLDLFVTGKTSPLHLLEALLPSSDNSYEMKIECNTFYSISSYKFPFPKTISFGHHNEQYHLKSLREADRRELQAISKSSFFLHQFSKYLVAYTHSRHYSPNKYP